ncbi:MAG TPA: short-chain dehydrogenase, partial [Thermodesulfobacteriota bacterium]
IGQPKDAEGAVVFLASVLGDFITGQYIPVSGGSYMP